MRFELRLIGLIAIWAFLLVGASLLPEAPAPRAPIAPIDAPSARDPVITPHQDAPTGHVSGTAFSADGRGVWLTAHHVVRWCVEIYVGDALAWQPAKVVHVDDASDVAAIATALGAPPLRPSSVPLGREQDGFSFGFPQARPGAAHGRLIGRARLNVRSEGRRYGLATAWAELRRLPDDSEPLGGISGGPVLDDSGRIIGVIVAASPRRGRFIAAAPEAVREIYAMGIAVDRPPRGRGDSFRIRADRLEAAERELRQRRTVARVACLTEAGRRARR